MNRLLLVALIAVVLSGCGPSAYEQAQRTTVLMKCRQADAFDQQCSDAYDLVYGQGQGAKEKARLIAVAPVSDAVAAQQEKDFHDRLFGKKPKAPVVSDSTPTPTKKN